MPQEDVMGQTGQHPYQEPMGLRPAIHGGTRAPGQE